MTAPAGEQVILISYVGYKTIEKTIILNSNQKLDIELTIDADQLDTVVIKAQESKKVNLSSPQMSVAKLSNKTIKL